MDQGFSIQFRHLAESSFPQRADCVEFVLSSFGRAVLESWAGSLSASIADLECVNAVIKRFRVSGRPESFSATAAKTMLKEAVVLFRQTHRKEPDNPVQKAAKKTRSMLTQRRLRRAAGEEGQLELGLGMMFSWRRRTQS